MTRLVWMLGALAMTLMACGDSEATGTEAVDAVCGEATCGPNEYCCDASCGLCIEMDVACNMTCP